MSRRQVRMNGSIAWMARNPVAANLLMVAILVGGLVSTLLIVRKEVFPQVEPDLVSIIVPYPGASPEEVEQGILLVVEEAVRNLDGIKEITSVAGEGSGAVYLDLENGADKNTVTAEVKNAVDRIVTFPLEAEEPIVMSPSWRAQAISIVLFGDLEEKILLELAEQTRDELLMLDEISYVELQGVRPFEITINVSSENLTKYNLTLAQIASKIRMTAIDLPAGGLKTRGGEILLRTTERRNTGEEFGDIAIVHTENGGVVTLREIAQIDDGFTESDVQSLFEGQKAITVNVYSVGDESPTDVASAAKRYVDGKKGQMPPAVSVSTWHDMAEVYAQRLSLLQRNAIFGLILVLVILGLFLEPRLAFWVTLGIPISFMGCLLLLPLFDVSINMVSMFAFIVTLGMVVDDAIVVGENTFRLRREGYGAVEAAVLGARQVAMPVTFSILTTIAAFGPLLAVPGTRGKFMIVIPIVVIMVLVFSLIESFFILPAHLAHLKKNSMLARFFAWQEHVARAVERFIEKVHTPAVRFCVKHWFVTICTGLGIFVFVMFGVYGGGIVKFMFWPEEESDWILVDARLPFGSPIEETEVVMQSLVKGAKEVIDEHGGEKIQKGIFSRLGAGRSCSGSHCTMIAVTLVPTDERDISSSEFARKWRKKVGKIKGVESMSFDASTGSSAPPVDVQLNHRDVKVLESAASELAQMMRTVPGVKDVDDGILRGKKQLDFRLSDTAISAGLTSADIANQVRGFYYGAQALRQQRGRYEVRVMVRLPKQQRQSITDIENILIRTPAGGQMPLRLAAEIDQNRAYTSIRRTNGKRMARVKARIDPKSGDEKKIREHITNSFTTKLKAKYPGLSFEAAGQQKSNDEFLDFLTFGYILALILIYGLIAIPLRSYLQPFFVVMAAIPYGLVGAVLGHLIMGNALSLISLMGMVALTGVVVNDSLVLVDAANRLRKEGLSPMDAAINASKQRYRAVILTSLTTFGGLSPMILETSVQARVLIPMAISLGFGVLFSTLVTLVIVPTNFYLVERVRDYWRAMWRDDESQGIEQQVVGDRS